MGRSVRRRDGGVYPDCRVPVGMRASAEEITIQPLPAAGAVRAGLGPEARALSSGPGYKGSPSWSRTRDRIAFTVDGYIVDRPIGAGESGAGRRGISVPRAPSGHPRVAWPSSAPRAGGQVRLPRESRAGSLGVEEVTTEGTGHESWARRRGSARRPPDRSGQSGLALAQRRRRARTGLHGRHSRTRRRAIALAGRRERPCSRCAEPGDPTPSELHVFDLRGGQHRRIARLKEGLEITGAPQWTREGICYIVGKEATQQGGGASRSTGSTVSTPTRAIPEPDAGGRQGLRRREHPGLARRR